MTIMTTGATTWITKEKKRMNPVVYNTTSSHDDHHSYYEQQSHQNNSHHHTDDDEDKNHSFTSTTTTRRRRCYATRPNQIFLLWREQQPQQQHQRFVLVVVLFLLLGITEMNCHNFQSENSSRSSRSSSIGVLVEAVAVTTTVTTTTTTTTTTPSSNRIQQQQQFVTKVNPDDTSPLFLFNTENGSIGDSSTSTVRNNMDNQNKDHRRHLRQQPVVAVKMVGTTERQTQQRIIGGTTVVDTTTKTSLALSKSLSSSYVISDASFLCGGTLIHDDIILTAAHCRSAYTKRYTVSVGGTNRNKTTNMITNAIDNMIPIDYSIVHPEYRKSIEKNDIMLVKLKRPVQNTTGTLQFSTVNYNPNFVQQQQRSNEPVTVIGYGFTNVTVKSPSTSNLLLAVNVTIMDFTSCSTLYKPYKLNETLVLCAGTILGGKDSCSGDSGGPLYAYQPITTTSTTSTSTTTRKRISTSFTTVPTTTSSSSYRIVQIGIVSHGFGCGEANVPAVYTRTSGYETFIKNTICIHSQIKPNYC